MKLIMAVSKDGYVARERDDDMSWTGPFDKAVFRLLTMVGGEMACGPKTYELMPKDFGGRTLHRLSTRPRAYLQGVRDLHWFQANHPDGWLLGGQLIALNAIEMGLVDEAFVCMSDRRVYPTDGEMCLLGMVLDKHSYTTAGAVKIGDVTVHVRRRRHG